MCVFTKVYTKEEYDSFLHRLVPVSFSCPFDPISICLIITKLISSIFSEFLFDQMSRSMCSFFKFYFILTENIAYFFTPGLSKIYSLS